MPLYPAAGSPPFSWRDFLFSAAIFLVTLSLFGTSPVSTVGDSQYSLLLTQNLLSRGSFVLDGYGIERKPVVHSGDADLDGDTYQIEIVHDHFYYYFPPGSSILSAPFVLIGDCFATPVVGKDGAYSYRREVGAQRVIAALLMAGLAVIFYFTGRLLLPVGWSALVALGGALGTQVWSTASRALWTHTWGISLLGFALFLLLARATGRARLRPVVLATVLSWTYFVRPTNSIFIIGFTVYILLYHREGFVAYAATGAAWFAGFVAYSWAHFGKILPSYYQGSRLETTQFWEALPGNLVSPSRGVFIYVPVALFVIYLVARHWRRLPHRPLAWLAAAVSGCSLLAVSCFVPWFGGGCYGPRYTTELVPWFVLLAVLGTRAALDWREDYGVRRRAAEWPATLAAGGALLFVSVLINAHGACAIATKRWNVVPVSVDDVPARVWDWRHPQILAGVVGSTPPAVFPALEPGRRVTFGNDAGRRFQLDGWSSPDADFCWTEENEATLVFAANDPSADRLRVCFGPYVRGWRLPRQRVEILLNGRRIASLVATEPAAREYTLALPQGTLQPRNTLTFKLPDAASPLSAHESDDDRTLGIALLWMELGQDAP